MASETLGGFLRSLVWSPATKFTLDILRALRRLSQQLQSLTGKRNATRKQNTVSFKHFKVADDPNLPGHECTLYEVFIVNGLSVASEAADF